MKRLICIGLALAMLLTAGCAYAEGEEEDAARVAVNLQAIKAALDRNELAFTYLEESDGFCVEFNLECAIQSCTFWIIAYDDGVHIQADYDMKLTGEHLDALANYLMYCNSQMRLGAYYIDYSEMFTGWEVFLYTDVSAPTQHSLDYAVATGLAMLENRGDRVSDILLKGVTAQEAIQMDQAAQKK